MKIEKHTVRDIPRRRFLELSMKGGLLIAATPALLISADFMQNGATAHLQDWIWTRRSCKDHCKSP